MTLTIQSMRKVVQICVGGDKTIAFDSKMNTKGGVWKTQILRLNLISVSQEDA